MLTLGLVAVGALGLGYLTGRLKRSSGWQDRLPDVVRSLWASLWRLVLVALFVGLWAAALVWMVATADRGPKELWALGTSAVFLLGLSLLAYGTGARQRTARSRIDLGGGKSTKVLANGELSDEQYNRLPRLDVEKVRSRYKASADFEIPNPSVRVKKGARLEAEEYDALPDALKSKVSPVYRTKQQLNWPVTAGQEPVVKPGDTPISAEEYAALPDHDKGKVTLRYTADTAFDAPVPATKVKKGLVDEAIVAAHPDAVKANATLVHIATVDLDVPAEDARIIEEGAPVSVATWREMTTQQRAFVSVQRGRFFRALYSGADGRWSTSKLQVLLWTYAVLFALGALYVFGELLNEPFDVEAGSGVTLGGFGDIQLQEQYLLLLGGPFAAAVVAKASTQSKVSNGVLVKSSDPQPSGAVEGLREVISNDAGQTDLMDFQYFMFNILALIVFAVTFIGGLADGIPELPWFLVGLTSTSALAYATKKSIERSQPQITRVSPERVRPGETLTIEGRALVAANRRPPQVSIAGRPATDVEVTSGTAADDLNRLTVTVPATTKPDDQTRVAVIPDGSSTAAEKLIEVIGPSISQVQPSTVPTVPGTAVLVFGEGFGDQPPAAEAVNATLGPIELHFDAADWSDTRVTFRVGSVSAVGTPRSGASEVRISIDGRGVAAAPLTLAASASAVDSVLPKPLTLTAHTSVHITGSGFGGDASKGQVVVGPWQLTDLIWRDDYITGTLSVDPVPPGYEQPKTVLLTVIPSDRPVAAPKEITVSK